MQQHIFPFVSKLDELQNSSHQPASSHCSSVQERLVNYGSEALDTAEHLGLILGSQKQVITHSVYSFILVHNHPSGDPSPSEADLRLTRVSAEARRFFTRSVQALGRLYGPSAAASLQTALRTMALFEGAMILARTLDDPKAFDDATRDLD